LTFFKEREIEKFIQPEEPELEPEPEEIPVQGIQLAGLKSSSTCFFFIFILTHI
jgi:hypothetical protein